MTGIDVLADRPLAASSPGSGRPAYFFDPLATVLSQYANSPAILALIDAFAQWLDPAARFDQFFDQFFNLRTAQGHGLDVWGRILGVNRVLGVPAGVYLGFESDPGAKPFGFGILYRGGRATNNVALTDEAYRTLLFAKAALNITNASIGAINAILINLFGDGYVRDNLDMSMTYVFTRALTPVETAIVYQSGVLPRPCGVSATVEQP